MGSAGAGYLDGEGFVSCLLPQAVFSASARLPALAREPYWILHKMCYTSSSLKGRQNRPTEGGPDIHTKGDGMRDKKEQRHERAEPAAPEAYAGEGTAGSAYSPAPSASAPSVSAPPCFLRGERGRGPLSPAEAEGAAGHVFAVVVSDASGDMHWFGAATEAAALALAGDVGRAFSGEIAVFARTHRFSPRSFPCCRGR